MKEIAVRRRRIDFTRNGRDIRTIKYLLPTYNYLNTWPYLANDFEGSVSYKNKIITHNQYIIKIYKKTCYYKIIYMHKFFFNLYNFEDGFVQKYMR